MRTCTSIKAAAVLAVAICTTAAVNTPAWGLPWASRPRAGGGLRAAIKAFKSFDDCMTQVGRALPAAVTSVVLDMPALRLVCRAHQAAAKDDKQACNKLGRRDYKLKKQCLRFYAVFSGNPSNCPTAGWPRYADGMCLALATRQRSLCRAAKPDQRPLCRALLGVPSACNKLAAKLRGACRAQVRAWRGVYNVRKPLISARFSPSFEASGTALTQTVKLPPNALSTFKSSRAAYGLLVADGKGAGDWLVMNQQFAPRLVYNWRNRPPLDINFWVPLTGGPTGTFGFGQVPGAGSAKSSAKKKPAAPAPPPPPGSSHMTQAPGVAGGTVRFRGANNHYRTMYAQGGKVTVTRFERKLGGLVAGQFDIVYSDGVDKVRVRGRFETFVRALVPRSRVARQMRYKSRNRHRARARRGYSSARLFPEEVREIASRIRKVRDNYYYVDPSIRARIVKNTAMVRYAGSISRRYQRSPSGQGYTYTCYRLYTVYRNTVLWLLGFRDKDVVCRVNRRRLDSAEDAYAAYAKLRRARSLVFEVERGSKTVKLRYRIRRVRPRRAKKRRRKRARSRGKKK